MKFTRTCALALGLVTLLATSVRADVPGPSQQLGALPGMTQEAPAISGTGVVWTNYDGAQFDIYYQDVSGGGARNLTAGSADNEFLEDIDNGFVVFTHTGGMTNSPGDVKLLDLATGKLTNVATGASDVHFAHPAINGNYVVFERITGTSTFDIGIYDKANGPLPAATDNPAMQLHPRVSGGTVVYEDYTRNPAGPPDVFSYTVPADTNTYAPIAQNAKWPDIDGNNIVFVATDAAGNGDQIVLYDLANKTSRTLTTAAGAKSMPRISGTRIVWTDGRNGTDTDLYTWDLTTDTEALLAGGPGNQATGDISANRVVYSSTDASGASSGVYLIAFAAPAPSDVPIGCDPAKTDLVGPVTPLAQSTKRAVYAHGDFPSESGKTYYMCIENGRANGVGRAAQVIAAVDGGIILTPADFRPEKSPPHFVTAKLVLSSRDALQRHDDGDRHEEGEHRDERGRLTATPIRHPWDVFLFQIDTSISISIRVAK